MAAMLWTAAIFIAFFLGASTSFQIAPYFYDLRGYFAGSFKDKVYHTSYIQYCAKVMQT